MAQQEKVKLPEGWVDTPLEEIAKWGAGGTPKRSETSYYGGDIPWVKTGDLGPKRLKVASEHITELGVRNSSAKLFTKGSVAIAMYGATIGKTSILDFDATTNQACAVGQPIADVTDTEFLYYILKNEKQNFIDKGKGGAQPNISQQIIKAHTIGFPPLPEQKRIVEKLDSLLAQVDTIQQRLNNLPDIIKRFRQSVLAAAVSGKLTEQWREINEVNDWKTLAIGDISTFQNGFAFKSGWFADSGKYQVIKLGNVKDDYLKLEKSPAFINSDIAKEYIKYKPNVGDILISMTGTKYKGDYGYVCRVNEDLPILINQRVGRIVAKPDLIDSNFLLQYMRSELFRVEFLKGETGGVNQGNVGTKHIQSCPIGIPSLKEQTEIVRLVEQYFALADTLEKNLTNAKQRVDNLTQSILAKAFRGELVPQDPNDEPADKLLARIKAARLEAEKLEKAAKKAAKASKK
ncbi:restriction endonuclease subunit S [Pseudoalteromonas tetraodonis]|uniref:restriction endonuclease subunit S n=1 Tax=Pseudoalteromonas tetraodonis TaxID=43659 RepID=UPI000849822D|nr:restriction endonuclease subunit S [Pseudoalteromonas tetraodonis]ODS14446.1 hypothetical protein BCD66_11130 [Pseudoalteromonas tetraodonis]